MLGKIINGILQTKEAVMIIDGKIVSNPTDEQLIADGYKDVIYTERPEGNYNQKICSYRCNYSRVGSGRD